MSPCSLEPRQSAHDDWLAARRTERALEMKALSQYQRDYDEAAAVAEEEDEFSWTKLGLAKAKMGDDRTDEYVVEGSNDETPTRALFLDEKTSKSPEWFTDDELTDDDEDNDEANSGFYTDEEELSPAEAARRVAPAQASAQAVDMKPAHCKHFAACVWSGLAILPLIHTRSLNVCVFCSQRNWLMVCLTIMMTFRMTGTP